MPHCALFGIINRGRSFGSFFTFSPTFGIFYTKSKIKANFHNKIIKTSLHILRLYKKIFRGNKGNTA